MVKRIKSELNIKKTDINKISENKFRVFTGPYLSLKALQKAYNLSLIHISEPTRRM